MARLPTPINGAEQYLAAIHDRLGDILDRLPVPQPAEPPPGPVELREPHTPPAENPPPGLAEPGPGLPPNPASARPQRKRATTKKIKES